MNILSFGHSDVGFVRESNEDSYLVDDARGLYAVADGVGGLPHGALASRLAIQFFRAMIRDAEECQTEEELRDIVHVVHQNIVESGVLVGGDNGIGTTFSAVRHLGDKILFAHVGDSSIFLRNGEGMKRISRHHTLGDELLEKHGPQALDDMPEHYMHTLTRCMGQDIDFTVDTATHSVKPGDRVVLCTDGVTNMVDEEDLATVVAEYEPQDFVPALIDLANQNGGADNSTIVAFVVN